MTTSTEPKTEDYLDHAPDDVEMSIFDHLEELRLRIFYGLIAAVVGIGACFFIVKPLVLFLLIFFLIILLVDENELVNMVLVLD